ncbi:helix-turn-helix transcriptional regulator [Microbispora sp. H10836]|uniref:helix-turn-helix domain-containing protein n=1 Tax=Microbispora sp. H10836 TaxID=2729106 RepID=UPI0014758BB6|nr:helix-turn-helix transcriptional regulator [Microbispora sp. H10836]
MAGANPTLRRRQLAVRLRELRQAVGLTVEDVANQLLCSVTKISRLETGQRGASLRDVRDLCQIYGVGESERDSLMNLAREARQPGWWQEWDDPSFRPYLGLEAEATSITHYETTTVPGLIQTEDYARAVIRGYLPNIRQDVLEERVAIRMKRQELLLRDDPPRYWVMLDESALHRHVGGPRVMREQLHRIVELADNPHIVVQVIPFTVGSHMGFDSAFILLEFADAAVPDTVFVETLWADFYLEKPSQLKRFHEVIDHLRAMALNPQASVGRITEIAETFTT